MTDHKRYLMFLYDMARCASADKSEALTMIFEYAAEHIDVPTQTENSNLYRELLDNMSDKYITMESCLHMPDELFVVLMVRDFASIRRVRINTSESFNTFAVKFASVMGIEG